MAHRKPLGSVTGPMMFDWEGGNPVLGDFLVSGAGTWYRVAGEEETRNPAKATLLHVDHNHETGAVRGLLCGPCNVGIGMLQDDPELVDRAANYLRQRAPRVVSIDNARRPA